MLKVEEDIPFVDKPWGYERLFAHSPHYMGKYIFIVSTHKTSRQYHQTRDQTLYVLTGPLHLEIGPDEEGEIISIGLVTGEAYRIEPGVVHRYCAPESGDVELIEVSTPHPQDIIRLEDDYGRILDFEA
tara:strand:+ start:1523 stop:1909 length:387 start_codon:yes stop_codon:yes gene_type:complete